MADTTQDSAKTRTKRPSKAKAKAAPKTKAKRAPKPKAKTAPKVKAKRTPKAKATMAPRAKAKRTPKANATIAPKIRITSDTNSIVVLGSTSAMARAAAIEFAKLGYAILLAARDKEENEAIAADIRVRCGAPAIALAFEAEEFAGHEAFFDQCRAILGDSLEGVILCFGYMADQADAQANRAEARRTVDVCYTAAVSILETFANYFEQRKRGFIAVVSSVAGDRGRQSNYIYGSAKAGLTTYLQGLRNRLFHAGVYVVTIKPGFVDTKMTFGLPGLFMVASPEKAGRDICKAICKHKNTAYVPFFWRYIMLIIQHIPEWQFKKMRM